MRGEAGPLHLDARRSYPGRAAAANADGEVKTAIVMGRLGLGAADPRERLDKARGHVRAALKQQRQRRRGGA